ncbi:MAG: DinB family protein [Acetobacterales bacterium]
MSASLLSQLETLSLYNRLANETLYDACATLPREELAAPKLTFFGTIIGTLNHILVVDRIWLDRFTGTENEHPPLDTILYGDFEKLREARLEEDSRIQEFVESLNIAFLASRFQFRDHTGQYRQDNADLLVLHFFNHQTHHRGQVHAMLAQSGVSELDLDLHRLIHQRRNGERPVLEPERVSEIS